MHHQKEGGQLAANEGYGSLKDMSTSFQVQIKPEQAYAGRGRYEVELTKVDSNFYQICGTNLYIETKYCYEYAIRDDAILNVTSSYGYTLGEVIFLE